MAIVVIFALLATSQV